MARPKPHIIIEKVDPISYNTEQILETDAIYAVFYDEKPINIRTLNKLSYKNGPKYKKVSFSNAGSAHRLARRLNSQFNTDKFVVYKLSHGVPHYGNPAK